MNSASSELSCTEFFAATKLVNVEFVIEEEELGRKLRYIQDYCTVLY